VKRCLIVIMLSLLVGPVAYAEDRASAAAAFEQGSQRYQRGELQQALASFREAYRSFADPSFLFDIGQCERQLGHKREAVQAYRGFLQSAPADGDRRQIEALVAQLERELGEETKPSPSAVITASAPPPARRRPAYEKWWVWTLAGGVVVAGAIAGVAVAATRGTTPPPSTTLGTQSPF
jgi:tetratricopeptide (TPR) repeat protein